MAKLGFARKRGKISFSLLRNVRLYLLIGTSYIGLKRVNSSKPFKKFKNLKLNPGAEKLVPKQPLENDSGEPVLHFSFLLRIFFVISDFFFCLF